MRYNAIPCLAIPYYTTRYYTIPVHTILYYTNTGRDRNNHFLINSVKNLKHSLSDGNKTRNGYVLNQIHSQLKDSDPDADRTESEPF